MEDGYLTLASWTKKILVEENHTISQLAHMLYIIVKYHKVYYLIRHNLINPMIASFQKVGLSTNSTPENRQLAIDLTEVILRWEAQRIRETQIYQSIPEPSETASQPQLTAEQQNISSLLAKHADMLKPFDKHVSDCLLNFFIRTACPAVDPQQQHQQQQNQQQLLNQNETLSKRCLQLFKTAMSNEIWPNADIKFDYLEKILVTLENVNNLNNLVNNTTVNPLQQSPTTSSSTPQQQQQPNYSSICICIEIIGFLVKNAADSRPKIQSIFRVLQRGLTACLTSTNPRVIAAVSSLIQVLMPLMPADFFNTNPASSTSATDSLVSALDSTTGEAAGAGSSQQQTDPVYTLFGQPDGILCKAILDSLAYYDKSSMMSNLTPESALGSTVLNTNISASIEVLTNCLQMLKAASSNNPQYIDRIMGPFMKILQKLYRDHLNATASLSNNMANQVPSTSASLENSNF